MELVGQQLGAYRILSLLGRGGTAEVYKAFHPALKREVAVKVILQEISRDHDWVRRFRQEAELLGRLDHPHILPVYDAGEHEGRPFLVMKYMADGQTLRTQLSGQPWPLNRTVKVVSQVAEALDAAHQAGVVHRDIKPSNILITSDLRCLVFDFGIAKPFRREDTTGSGLIVGTPEFMSPEQCKGDKIDHRSDVYSLGVMTYQMLTGHVPFSAETAVGILMKHLTEPLPIPPRGVALPPAVNGMLRRSMARDARDRFNTAGEFGEALQQSADQRATVTLHASEIRRAATPTLKLPAWVRKFRKPEVRLGVAGGVLALILTAIYAVWPSTPAAVQSASATSEPQPALVSPGVDGAGPNNAPQPAVPSSAQPTPSEASTAVRTDANSISLGPSISLGGLQIESNASAKVLLDGQPIGTAPGVFQSVEPGRRSVAVDAGQGRVQQQSVVVTPGSTHHLRFNFDATPVDVTGAMARPHQSGADVGGTTASRAPRVDTPPPAREWTGWLTDADCGTTGGKQGALHLRCAERCIRAGQQPMLYSRGKLYRIDGFEHVTLVRGEPLTVKGWLEVDTIHVSPPES